MEVIENKGKLAIASPWRADYDKPVMGRLVWSSAIEFEPALTDWRVLDIPGASTADTQWWALALNGGIQRTLRTPLHGEYQTGAPIKAPRKSKNQTKPWRWEAGRWVK